jgi:hypothetical protein
MRAQEQAQRWRSTLPPAPARRGVLEPGTPRPSTPRHNKLTRDSLLVGGEHITQTAGKTAVEQTSLSASNWLQHVCCLWCSIVWVCRHCGLACSLVDCGLFIHCLWSGVGCLPSAMPGSCMFGCFLYQGDLWTRVCWRRYLHSVIAHTEAPATKHMRV